MRSKDFGIIANLSEELRKEDMLEVWRKMCQARFFEFNVKDVFDAGRIKCPIYLSVGHESIPAAISTVYKNPYIFAQHRAHATYLSFGGDPVSLIDELLHRSAGCAKGMGGSASIHDPKIGMFGHSGLMGDQIPVSVGFALGSHKNTLAVMGDAAAEEDYIASSFGYAAHKKLPILFVCEDNNLSILTKIEVRRNWKTVDVAKAFGLEAVEIADDPWVIMHYVKQLLPKLPAFMNVHTVRHLWHAGTGKDSEPEWSRSELTKQELARIGLEEEAKEIEEKAKVYIDGLWEKQLVEN